jgi:DNA-binding IscR family transcriptional regulator
VYRILEEPMPYCRVQCHFMSLENTDEATCAVRKLMTRSDNNAYGFGK